MIPTRSRTARCSSPTRSNQSGRAHPRSRGIAAVARPRLARPMEIRALPAGLRAEDGARRPRGDRAARRGGAAGRRRPRRTGIGGGSSRHTSRERDPRSTPGRGRCPRIATPGTARCRRPGSPAVIQPATARPIPPPPPNPLSDSPAATQKPRTPGIGPMSGFASGVIASGWQTRRTASASARNGKRRIAPSISGWNRSQSGGSEVAACSHGTPVQPARVRLRLVAAEQHPAVLGLAVDEVVRVAEARHVVGQLVARDRLAARRADGRRGSTG